MVCNPRKISLAPPAAVPVPIGLASCRAERSPTAQTTPHPPTSRRARPRTVEKLCLLTVGLLSSGASEPTTSATPSLPQPLPSAADAAQRQATAVQPIPQAQVQPGPAANGVEFSSGPDLPPHQATQLVSFQPEQSGGQAVSSLERSPQTLRIPASRPTNYRLPLPGLPLPDWPSPSPAPSSPAVEFSASAVSVESMPTALPIASPRPQSGPQLYHQRWAALASGSTYTRLPSHSFSEMWSNAAYSPNLEDWQALLSQEAAAVAAGQGNNALTVILGDSISLWYPRDFLPQNRFWLNQAISGDTAKGMLKRLDLFDQARPDQIHIMAGINDLRQGATDQEVVDTLEEIIHQLQQRHPNAQIIVHSILPTRLSSLPTQRIQGINQQLAAIAQQKQVTYADLHSLFLDQEGQLQRELTTDGLHLSLQGYALWYRALQSWGLT
ncbi:MAG: GDSL-type esterase/lipase family protein [Synechococcales bacterium]|nr:GDSL-type esterase/lipase family protein [Synechococcales bacterium]